MAEVNEESLWLSSGACNLVSSCGQGKILVLSAWPRSSNVASVSRCRGTQACDVFRCRTGFKLFLHNARELLCDRTLPGSVTPGSAAPRVYSDSVDMMDAMPGFDRDDCQDHSGYLCGPSEAYMRLHCAVLADQLLAFPLDYKCALHVLLMFCSCVVVQVHCR